MNKAKKAIICIICIPSAFFLVVDGAGVSKAINNSINSCLTIIIPSLFGFMVLSSVIIESGIYSFLFKPLHMLFGKIFNMDLFTFSVFAISLMGGYPIGAKLLAETAADERNRKICENMLCYCYCPSPPFVITVIGLCVFGNTQSGLIIYLSNVISCAFAALFINKINRHIFFSPNTFQKNNVILFSINSSSVSLFKMSSVIIFFSVIIEFIRYTGLLELIENNINPICSGIAVSLLEISNISALTNADTSLLLPIAAALSSFGGFCILIQTAVLTHGAIKLKKFLAARLPIALLSAVTAYFISHFFPAGAAETSSAVNYVQFSSVKPLASAFLITMCIILLKNSKKISKKGSFL